MSIYEYDEELHFRTLIEEGRELGREEGREMGREEGLEKGREEGEIHLARVNQLHSILIDMGRIDDLKRATQDKAYQKQLMSELLPGEVRNM